jgi:hypothetical protein
MSSPIACNLNAIGPADRPRYNKLVERLRAAIREKTDLSDGYTYRLDTESITQQEVAEWISLEKRCCPFLTFELKNSQLTLRGPAGAKEILQVGRTPSSASDPPGSDFLPLLRLISHAVDLNPHHGICKLSFHRSPRRLLIPKKLRVNFVHLRKLASVL